MCGQMCVPGNRSQRCIKEQCCTNIYTKRENWGSCGGLRCDLLNLQSGRSGSHSWYTCRAYLRCHRHHHHHHFLHSTPQHSTTLHICATFSLFTILYDVINLLYYMSHAKPVGRVVRHVRPQITWILCDKLESLLHSSIISGLRRLAWYHAAGRAQRNSHSPVGFGLCLCCRHDTIQWLA